MATASMNNEENSETVPSHLFVELTSLSELSFPTTASSRIKYTCVCSSPHILAVGSSSGTVYLFSRYAAKNRKSLSNVPVQIIPCQEGAITLVELSPDEKCLAVATNRGYICILNISKNSSTTLLTNVHHISAEITYLRFSSDGSRLFAGDSIGRVSCSKLSNKLSLRSPCEIILKLDSRIVQIDHFHSQLLVSTLSRCCLHDIARQTTRQIGSKLRNGHYGACFFPNETVRAENGSSISMDHDIANNSAPLIFCARPGGRLWEVDSQGKVYSTHQFAGIRNIFGLAGLRDFTVNRLANCSTISFGTVHVIGDFIISVNNRALVLVDPKRAKLILANDIGEDVSQFHICENDVFLLNADGYLRKVTLFPLEKAIEKLVFRERFTAAAQVIYAIHDISKMYSFRFDLLRNIRSRITDSKDDVLARKLDDLMDIASRSSSHKFIQTPRIARLASGIHKVVKGMENSGYEDDFTFHVQFGHRSRDLSKSPSKSQTRRCKSTSSVNRLDLADEAVGNALVVDPPNGQDIVGRSSPSLRCTCRDDSCPNDKVSVSLVGTMATSRSEDSLAAMLNNKPTLTNELQEETFNDEAHGNVKPLGQGNIHYVHSSPSMGQSNSNSKSKTAYLFMDNVAVINDPLGLSPATLKETLKVGGKLLLDAVQKVNLLSLNPEFMDPNLFIGNPNGIYDESPNTKAIDGIDNREGTVVSNVHFTPFDLDNQADTIMDVSPVVYSAGSGRLRQKRTKVNGKAYGQVVKGRNSSVDAFSAKSIAENAIFQNDISPSHLGEPILPRNVASQMESPNLPRCKNCGLHNTWRFVLMIGPFIDKLSCMEDTYKEGGVPLDVNGWNELIMEWKKRKSTYLSSKHALCSGCSHLWTSLFAHLDSSTTNQNQSPERNVDEVVGTLSSSALENIFGCLPNRQSTSAGQFNKGTVKISDIKGVDSNDLPITKDAAGSADIQEDELAMAVSMYYNPLYESVCGDLDGDDNWKWLPEISLDALFAVCTKVIGDTYMTDLILRWTRDDIDGLTSDFYRFISSGTGNGLLNGEVLGCIAQDSNLSGAFVAEPKPTVRKCAIRIDNQQFCPCCTLPLTSIVAETDQRIFIFDCGHSYHRICMLSHAKSPYSCLVCKVTST